MKYVGYAVLTELYRPDGEAVRLEAITVVETALRILAPISRFTQECEVESRAEDGRLSWGWEAPTCSMTCR